MKEGHRAYALRQGAVHREILRAIKKRFATPVTTEKRVRKRKVAQSHGGAGMSTPADVLLLPLTHSTATISKLADTIVATSAEEPAEAAAAGVDS